MKKIFTKTNRLIVAMIIATVVFGMMPVQSASAESGSLLWQEQYSPANSNPNRYAGMAKGVGGSVYVAGDAQSKTSFYYSVYITKYDTEGNKVWDNSYSINQRQVTFAGIASDSSGNVYVLTEDDGTNYVTIKYDSSGNQLWATSFSGGYPHIATDNSPQTISVDDSGNVYIVGTQSGVLAVKYDQDGNQLWASRYGSGFDRGISSKLDASGNLYVVGNATTGSNTDAVVIKYNTSGMQQWVSRYDANSDETLNDIVIDSSNNVYATGVTNEQSSIGQPQNYLTLKINSNGTQAWAKTYGSDGYYSSASSIKVDQAGNVYVTGTGSNNGFVMATVKYANNGDQLWANRYSYLSQSQGTKLQLNNLGDVYVGGSGYSSGTNYDFAIVKYGTDGTQKFVSSINNGGTDIVRDMLLYDNDHLYINGYSCDVNSQNCLATIAKYEVAYLPSPSNLRASSPTNSPILNWDTVTGATSYNIYRNGVNIGSSTQASYTDTNAPDGNNSYYVTAVKNTDESQPSNITSVMVDRTNPLITYTASPQANANGWHRSNVTITFNCTDALSGVQSCSSPITISSEGSNQAFTGNASDKAGNTSAISGAIKLDKTIPTISGLTMNPTFILFQANVTITANATDSLSGVTRGEYFIDADPGQGNATTMSFNNGQLSASRTIQNIGFGQHTLYARSVDAAGNWSTLASRTFTYIGF